MVGRFPGGLALATMLACTGFAACSGSSLASAATMGTVAFPEMEEYRYDRRLSTGAICAGGLLSPLIPPSALFIVFGILTGTSIAKLFLAGILPGLLLSVVFLFTIVAMCKRNPKLGPLGPSYSWRERFVSLKGVWGMLVLFVLIIGGLYVGIFTPSEAGAIGAFGAFIIGITKRRLNFSSTIAAVKESAKVTCFIFIIFIGAMIFNSFLAKAASHRCSAIG
jgi:tripartite ATP-independent transporter DctM subunit